jgi:hypothetical protein
MSQITTNTVAEKYFYVFYGSAPSILMARVAYRRVGKQEPRSRHERKVINCPYCKKPMTDVDIATKVELYCHPAQKQVRCQVYPKCHNCGNEVGMIIAS